MAIRVCWEAYGTPFGGGVEVVGVSDCTIRKSDGGFLSMLSGEINFEEFQPM